MHSQLAPDDPGGALQALYGGAAVVRIEQTIHLRAACLHELGHALFCDFLFLHLSRKLAGNHGLDGRRRNFRPDAFGIEPAFEASIRCAGSFSFFLSGFLP
jgi:hypothetical protein